jgi:hypothetical protein
VRGTDWTVRRGGNHAAEPGAATNGDGNEDGVDWAQRTLGFEADAKQAQVLRSGGRRGILNCSRQWGKSTVTAVKALHYALHEADSLTIVVSPTRRQSRELVLKAAGFATHVGVRPRGAGGGDVSLALPNGSRIVGLPGSEGTIRGFSSVGLLLIDEASRVSDELYVAVRPMLAVSDGALWMMSTPNGRQGFFWETWSRGGPEWVRIEAPATDCARISREFLEGERQTLPTRAFRQEYLCEFTDSRSAVFDGKLVAEAFTKDFAPLSL